MLERDLDRPVVDETDPRGLYSFALTRGMKTKDQFFEEMYKEVGLLVSSGKRDVGMLIVRPR